MSIKHTNTNVYLTPGGDGDALFNGVALENNTLPPILANYLAEQDTEGGYGVILPDVIVMDGETLTFCTIGASYEGAFQIVAGSFGGGNASINIQGYPQIFMSSPGATTLLADGVSGVWWIVSQYTD